MLFGSRCYLQVNLALIGGSTATEKAELRGFAR